MKDKMPNDSMFQCVGLSGYKVDFILLNFPPAWFMLLSLIISKTNQFTCWLFAMRIHIHASVSEALTCKSLRYLLHLWQLIFPDRSSSECQGDAVLVKRWSIQCSSNFITNCVFCKPPALFRVQHEAGGCSSVLWVITLSSLADGVWWVVIKV